MKLKFMDQPWMCGTLGPMESSQSSVHRPFIPQNLWSTVAFDTLGQQRATPRLAAGYSLIFCLNWNSVVDWVLLRLLVGWALCMLVYWAASTCCLFCFCYVTRRSSVPCRRWDRGRCGAGWLPSMISLVPRQGLCFNRECPPVCRTEERASFLRPSHWNCLWR